MDIALKTDNEKDEIFIETINLYCEVENLKLTMNNLLNNAFLSIAKTKFRREYQKYILDEFINKSKFKTSLEIDSHEDKFKIMVSNKSGEIFDDIIVKRRMLHNNNQGMENVNGNISVSQFTEISNEFLQIISICVEVANLSNRAVKLTEHFLS